jgi:hypothetical protein
MAQGLLQPPQFVRLSSGDSQPLLASLSQLPNSPTQVGWQWKVPIDPVQVLLPWALVQALPQLAQLLGVPSVVSQPADALQSAKPVVQVPIAQLMVEPLTLQLAAAFGNEQAELQLPQSLSVVMDRSQPLSGLLSQLLKPKLQLGVHATGEPAQLVVPFWAVQV